MGLDAFSTVPYNPDTGHDAIAEIHLPAWMPSKPFSVIAPSIKKLTMDGGRHV